MSTVTTEIENIYVKITWAYPTLDNSATIDAY
jgi:hypothetical protein